VAGALDWSAPLLVLLALLFLSGVQLISLGIIGRYLARVHEESLRRPLYLISRVVRGRPVDSVAGAEHPDGDAGREA
jgi:dolichol-phosphate mannosyltransferase